MTKDEALTMIIASIAMEELALSHIINAEGEKLQYILGTLPGGHGTCASTQEILAVNQSVKELLDTVMQSQMLLKGKLEKALGAAGCPPTPPHPCGPSHPDRPSCGGGSCCGKSAIQLAGRCSGLTWENGSRMSWKCQEQRGCGIRWNEKTPALVSLDPGKAYMMHYTINVRDTYPGGSTGVIFVRITPCGAFSNVLPLCFSVNCRENKPVTLQYAATLFPQACSASRADLSLLLNYRDKLFVDQASLSIVEM